MRQQSIYILQLLLRLALKTFEHLIISGQFAGI